MGFLELHHMLSTFQGFKDIIPAKNSALLHIEERCQSSKYLVNVVVNWLTLDLLSLFSRLFVLRITSRIF